MFFQQNELERAGADCLRKKHIENQLSQLYPQREELRRKEADLGAIRYKEEDDVRQLTTGSLAALFYAIIGQKEKKLEKEQAEAREAAVRHDAASAQLTSLEEDIARLEGERKKLLGVENLYHRLLEEKAEAIKKQPGEPNDRLTELEEQLMTLKEQYRETEEAFSAGNSAAELLDDIANQLTDAHGWGTYDLLGGGLIAGMVKHDHIDQAQNLLHSLQILLRRYRNELNDISLSLPPNINIDSFLRFADYFYDGLIADWTVLGKIEEAQQQISHTRTQVADLQSKLRAILAGQKTQLEALEEEKRRFVQQS